MGKRVSSPVDGKELICRLAGAAVLASASLAVLPAIISLAGCVIPDGSGSRNVMAALRGGLACVLPLAAVAVGHRLGWDAYGLLSRTLGERNARCDKE